MATVALVVHPARAEATEVAKAATAWLTEGGHDVRVMSSHPDDETRRAWAESNSELSLAVSLGGDGTMLSTVNLAVPRGIPILGVNLGHLGYLTEVEAKDLQKALERFMNGDYQIEERLILEVLVESPNGERDLFPPRLALNEAVVEKTLSGHTIRVAASIAGRPFISYAADGILVATPTGSTAYNLSARGPIVSPGLQALMVTPLSPHMLFDRTLVLEPSQWLRLQLMGPRPAALVVDGSAVTTLEPLDAVICRAGAHPARLVTFGPRDFHAILKAKFGLADR